MKDSAEVVFTAPGSYGTGEVHVAGLNRGREDLVVLLHGVHGCAERAQGNKYDNLAGLLDQAGFDVLMVQTSRSRFDREAFGEDRNAWARDAFRGKTYAMDFFDALSALAAVRERYEERRLWLWGFSLGGIHWTMAAGGMGQEILAGTSLQAPPGELPELEGILLSGSGLNIVDKDHPILELPILSTIPSPDCLARAATKVRTRNALAFYGGEDGTFSEEACRRLLELIPARERKLFKLLPGVDHPFRHIHGRPSVEPLKTMVEGLRSLSVFQTPG